MVINEYYRSGWFITGLGGYDRSGWLLMSITDLGGLLMGITGLGGY